MLWRARKVRPEVVDEKEKEKERARARHSSCSSARAHTTSFALSAVILIVMLPPLPHVGVQFDLIIILLVRCAALRCARQRLAWAPNGLLREQASARCSYICVDRSRPTAAAAAAAVTAQRFARACTE